MPNLTHSDFVCKREIIVILLGRDICTDFSLQSCRSLFFQSDLSKHSSTTVQYSDAPSIRYNALIKVDHPVCLCSNNLHSFTRKPPLSSTMEELARTLRAVINQPLQIFSEKSSFFSPICKTRAGHPRQPASKPFPRSASQLPRRPLIFQLLVIITIECQLLSQWVPLSKT